MAVDDFKAKSPDDPMAIGANNSMVKLFSSEFLGTFILVYIGQCVVTSFELTGTQSETSIKLLGTLICYSLTLLIAQLLTVAISGGHLNPAYTVASATFGHFKWRRVPIYLLGQYCGSFVAACFIHITYNDKIAHRHAEGLLNGMNMTLRAHGNILSSGKFFTTFPPIEVSLAQLFISYTLATAQYSMLFITIYESRLIRLPRYLQPAYMAVALLVTQAAFCANGGPVINPAVDFSPRLYISISGWGSGAFNLYHFTYWWLCGLLAPHFGALLGVGFYKLILDINNHRSNNNNTSTNSNNYEKCSSRGGESMSSFAYLNGQGQISSFTSQDNSSPANNTAQSLLPDRDRQRVSTSTMISNISCASRTIPSQEDNMRQHNRFLEKYQQDS